MPKTIRPDDVRPRRIDGRFQFHDFAHADARAVRHVQFHRSGNDRGENAFRADAGTARSGQSVILRHIGRDGRVRIGGVVHAELGRNLIAHIIFEFQFGEGETFAFAQRHIRAADQVRQRRHHHRRAVHTRHGATADRIGRTQVISRRHRRRNRGVRFGAGKARRYARPHVIGPALRRSTDLRAAAQAYAGIRRDAVVRRLGGQHGEGETVRLIVAAGRAEIDGEGERTRRRSGDERIGAVVATERTPRAAPLVGRRRMVATRHHLHGFVQANHLVGSGVDLEDVHVDTQRIHGANRADFHLVGRVLVHGGDGVRAVGAAQSRRGEPLVEFAARSEQLRWLIGANRRVALHRQVDVDAVQNARRVHPEVDDRSSAGDVPPEIVDEHDVKLPFLNGERTDKIIAARALARVRHGDAEHRMNVRQPRRIGTGGVAAAHRFVVLRKGAEFVEGRHRTPHQKIHIAGFFGDQTLDGEAEISVRRRLKVKEREVFRAGTEPTGFVHIVDEIAVDGSRFDADDGGLVGHVVAAVQNQRILAETGGREDVRAVDYLHIDVEITTVLPRAHYDVVSPGFLQIGGKNVPTR